MVAHWNKGLNHPLPDLPRQPLGPDHNLAPFVRHAFVGEAQKTLWKPRITAVRAALARLNVMVVARGMAAASIADVRGDEVLSIHNLAAEYSLHAILIPHELDGERRRLIIGQEKMARDCAVALQADDFRSVAELTGVPACCRDQCTDPHRGSPRDSLLNAFQINRGEPVMDLCCNPFLNPLLRPIGLALTEQLPCSFDCEASKHVAIRKLELARSYGLGTEMDWLEAMLGWPAEWSALHGIAEVKTGILKIAHRIAYTPFKRVVRYLGRAPASDSARALLFPYAPHHKPPRGDLVCLREGAMNTATDSTSHEE